jgi:hypothetical protein
MENGKKYSMNPKADQQTPPNYQNMSRLSHQMPANASNFYEKGMKKYTCKYLYCGLEFYSKYKRDYCPNVNDACYKAEKSLRQSKVNALVAEIKKGLYANYKIFREFLPNIGQIRINYDDALKKGFDEHAFYSTHKFSEVKWYMLNEYYFFIEHSNNNRFLHIYKP